MSTCVFNIKGNSIVIQCTEQETMGNICKNLASKALIDINNYYFLYNGTLIDMNLTFERQANHFDREKKQMFILVVENNQNNNNNIKETMCKDLINMGLQILRKHLDGRTYKEIKVYDWINSIINEFETYFYQKYPSYNIFSFCLVCSKFTFFLSDDKAILSKEEAGNKAVFSNNDIHSVLSFFFFKNFTSMPCPYFEPRLIQLGNKLLYEIFDERKFGQILKDGCIRLNKEVGTNILEIPSGRRCLLLTFAFKRPVKDISYFYKVKPPFELARIIQNFVTNDVEIWHFLFIVSNDNK